MGTIRIEDEGVKLALRRKLIKNPDPFGTVLRDTGEEDFNFVWHDVRIEGDYLITYSWDGSKWIITQSPAPPKENKGKRVGPVTDA